MKFSQSTFVYYRYPLETAIRRLADFGYDGVEIWGGRPHAFWEDMDDGRINSIKNLLDETGLEISNFIPAQFRYPVNIATTDQRIRKRSIDYLKRNIDVAEALQAPSVSICPGFSLFGEPLADSRKAMMDSLSACIDHAKGMSLNLLIEPAHSMETDHVLTVEHAMSVIDELGKEWLGLCIDTGHMFINRESLSTVPHRVGGYTVHYHLDDNGGVNDDHLVPGEGRIDFDLFLRNLGDTGYNGFLAFELGWGYTADPDVAVSKSLDFIKRKQREVT